MGFCLLWFLTEDLEPAGWLRPSDRDLNLYEVSKFPAPQVADFDADLTGFCSPDNPSIFSSFDPLDRVSTLKIGTDLVTDTSRMVIRHFN